MIELYWIKLLEKVKHKKNNQVLAVNEESAKIISRFSLVTVNLKDCHREIPFTKHSYVKNGDKTLLVSLGIKIIFYMRSSEKTKKGGSVSSSY